MWPMIAQCLATITSSNKLFVRICYSQNCVNCFFSFPEYLLVLWYCSCPSYEDARSYMLCDNNTAKGMAFALLHVTGTTEFSFIF